MGATVIIGGQYGSEGKGKVALEYARIQNAKASIRVGGCNSGHTVYSNGTKYALKVLPTSVLKSDVLCIIPSGAYFKVHDLLEEAALFGITGTNRLVIDKYAVIVTDELVANEVGTNRRESIGTTNSGTGEAVIERIKRTAGNVVFAKDIPELSKFVVDTKPVISDLLENEEQIIVEGTQGFGLSLLHTNTYPYVTSRDTTAAAFISEAGISPFDVTHIVMVLRAYPIRVAGNSGVLEGETSWDEISKSIGKDVIEYTTVTKKVRRVGTFEPNIVRRAIQVNKPNIIVMNHLDYIDGIETDTGEPTDKQLEFIKQVEKQIGCRIDCVSNNKYTIDCV